MSLALNVARANSLLRMEIGDGRMAFRSPSRFKVIGVLGGNLNNTTSSQNPKLRNYDYELALLTRSDSSYLLLEI